VAEIEASMFGQFRITGQRWGGARRTAAAAPVLHQQDRLCGPQLMPDHAGRARGRGAKDAAVPEASTSLIGAHEHRSCCRRSPPGFEHEPNWRGDRRIGGSAQARPPQAARAIFGYTVANDVTARDLQRSDGQWTRAKGFDTFCPLGPWIVTDVDPSDPRSL